MRNVIRAKLTLSVILAFAAAFFALAANAADLQLTQSYKNPDLGFSFKYPASWDITEDAIGEASIMSPNNDGVYIGFSGEPSPTAISDVTQEMLESTGYSGLEGFKWVSFKKTDFKGMECIVTEFTLDDRDEEGNDFSVKIRQYIFSGTENTYMITICSPTEEFDRYRGLFDVIVDSFSK